MVAITEIPTVLPGRKNYDAIRIGFVMLVITAISCQYSFDQLVFFFLRVLIGLFFLSSRAFNSAAVPNSTGYCWAQSAPVRSAPHFILPKIKVRLGANGLVVAGEIGTAVSLLLFGPARTNHGGDCKPYRRDVLDCRTGQSQCLRRSHWWPVVVL